MRAGGVAACMRPCGMCTRVGPEAAVRLRGSGEGSEAAVRAQQ